MVDTTSAETIMETCRAYQAGRVSDYAFRCIRFDAVIDKLVDIGLQDGDSVLDLGCGRGEMENRFIERGWSVKYDGVDGAIDGVDLNTIALPNYFDWIIAIEIIEHLYDPTLHLHNWFSAARKGVVLTTPNPRTVDVLACDPTHVSVVTPEMLDKYRYKHFEVSLFKNPYDSLLAWKKVEWVVMDHGVVGRISDDMFDL